MFLVLKILDPILHNSRIFASLKDNEDSDNITDKERIRIKEAFQKACAVTKKMFSHVLPFENYEAIIEETKSNPGREFFFAMKIPDISSMADELHKDFLAGNEDKALDLFTLRTIEKFVIIYTPPKRQPLPQSPILPDEDLPGSTIKASRDGTVIATREQKIVVAPRTGTNAAICSDLAPQAVLDAIVNAKYSTDPLPDAKSTRGHTFSRLEQKQGIAEVSLLAENALKLLQQVDAYTTDAILIHFEEWRENRDEKGYAWMTAEAMVKSRGIKPKTKKEGSIPYSSGYRPEDYAEAYRRVQQLEEFWLTIQIKDVWTNVNKGNVRKSRTAISEGRLLVISRRERLPGIDGEKDQVYAWQYRLFEGLEELVNDDCFAYVSRKVLGYDYYHEIPEKRIGLYSAIHLKMNHMNPIPRKVITLRDACRIPYDKKRPQKFIDRFHKALKRLVEDRVIHDWNYLLDGKFDGKKKLISGKLTKNLEDLKLPRRDCFEHYMEKTLWLEPNPDIPRTKRKGDESNTVSSSPPPTAFPA